VAKHPVTHPLLKVIEKSEHNLDDVIGPLMDKAVETAETILVK
jgi:thiamine biosynthesis protein ThiI